MLSHEAAHLYLSDQLKSPARDADIRSVPSVGEVVVKDRFDRFRGTGTEPVVADVESVVCVGCEDLKARATKGAMTASLYSASASSPMVMASSGCSAISWRTLVRLTSSGLPLASCSVHDSMPTSR